MLLLKKKKYAAVTLEKDRDGNMIQKTELKGKQTFWLHFLSFPVFVFDTQVKKNGNFESF